MFLRMRHILPIAVFQRVIYPPDIYLRIIGKIARIEIGCHHPFRWDLVTPTKQTSVAVN